MQEAKDLLQLLRTPRNIVVTSHRNPDGDAIGSSLALKSVLEKKFHNVKVVLPSEYPFDVAWLEGIDDIIIYDRDQGRATDAIAAADVVFCLD
ncbi:MAG TPA: DHH family phosphoesterase, partial [Saprospiraceae bacterium]|nr:DHH family phosphoesterase [Saprospiraceae bacterium]